jgi:hypothetical protein
MSLPATPSVKRTSSHSAFTFTSDDSGFRAQERVPGRPPVELVPVGGDDQPVTPGWGVGIGVDEQNTHLPATDPGAITPIYYTPADILITWTDRRDNNR